MPTEHDWEDEEPLTEEDAIKRVAKRVDRLSKGMTGELWEMHQNCHKEAFENANPDHMPPDSPMVFVRDESTPGEKKELFHICRKCFSNWYVKQSKKTRGNVTILRGSLTEEAITQLRGKNISFAER